ncbi:hypothetical protein CLU83_1391 [Flavobacterium sp. 1]|uniref:glycan-binding surface protein n=1 Tax=Flavobacterium sp. 1 TaxID=2035200 RepID=UPI000C23D032|nr:glycan-binding surface protein [Flavobacterium sp. 1]PJJ08147.1 hypothetical protein CLU83_1391 [Flavobacterium sp. 1]
MKKKLNKFRFLLLFCSVAIGILAVSCNNEDIGSPVIIDVRNYAASPKDTIMTDAIANEQWVVIEGQNLGSALRITFDGVSTSFNTSLITPNNAVVKIPAIVFSKVDENKMYTLEYTTSQGTATFSFHIGPAAPSLTAISDVFAQPNDSVYVYGKDLFLVKSLSYGGVPITSFKADTNGTSVGFLMPNPAPTSGDVVITTLSGMATFKIAAIPTIAGISNENAIANDSVYVYGTYLKSIESISFGGTAITSFKSNSNGRSVGFVLPSSPQTGPVSITTAFGSVTTPYNVHTPTYLQDGVIMNFEGGWDFNGMEGWWGAASGAVNNAANDSFGWLTHTTEFDGVYGTNNTLFPYLNKGVFAGGEGNNWGGTGTNLKPNQWIPTANLSDSVDDWAIKFEMSVAKPWNGISLCFETYFDGSYVYRFEPWKISASSTVAFSTKGWVTVTIPLSAFRAKDTDLGAGMGAPVTSISALLGTGKTGLHLYLKNFGTTNSATGFYGAFDNIRVVKIK